MKKLPVLIFLVLILSMGVVAAVPPFQTSSGTDVGLVLRTPVLEHLQINETINSHMHIFNLTNDLPITPSAAVDCNIHLYNSVGTHLLQKKYGIDSNGLEYVLEITGGNFSATGMYSFIIWCNSTTEGGFVSGGFDVTENGSAAPSEILQVVFFLIFLALLFGMIFSFLRVLGFWKDLNVDVLDFAGSLGIYMVLFAFAYLCKTYLGDVVINDLLNIMIIVGGVTHVFAPAAAFAASLILNPLKKGIN